MTEDIGLFFDILMCLLLMINIIIMVKNEDYIFDKSNKEVKHDVR